jgi:hypothetical protein
LFVSTPSACSGEGQLWALEWAKEQEMNMDDKL